MFGWIKSLFCDHKWSYGKAAPSEARSLGWKCLHNRVCVKCSKVEDAADRAEVELQRIATLRAGICTEPVDFEELARRAEELLYKEEED